MNETRWSYRQLFPTTKDVLKDVLNCIAMLARLMVCFVFGVACVVLCIPHVVNFVQGNAMPSWLGFCIILISLVGLVVAGMLIGCGFCLLIKRSFDAENA